MGKVLLVAPSCDGTDVGEAWVAYQWAKGLSERHDVTVLTYRGTDRPSAVSQLPLARVIEWSQPAFFSHAPRFNSLLKPWFPLFYMNCRRWLREALARGEAFDIAHQPAPVALRYPSPLVGSKIPYVLGPVGGSLESPLGFRNEDTAPWYVGLRKIDSWRLTHDPLLRRSYQQASVVLAIAPYVESMLSDLHLHDLRFMSDVGVMNIPENIDRSGRANPVRLLFVGRLIRTKGARDAIAAVAELHDLPVVLDIVGDGFDRAACEQLVHRLGLVDRVVFHGAQQRSSVDKFYRAADIFVFPSYREPGGTVQFEAMAFGLPLILSDRGGPANVVDEACAVLVAPIDPAQYAHDLAAALRLLIVESDLRLRMGLAARERAAQCTWAKRIDDIEQIYVEIAGG